MIQINEKYRLVGDELNIRIEELVYKGAPFGSTLAQKKEYEKGERETRWVPIDMYFTNVENAVKQLFIIQQSKIVGSDEIISLREFFKQMKELNDEIKNAMYGKQL